MRFLIAGGGALGTVVAAYLARAGNEVTLFVRPQRQREFAAPEVRLTGIVDFAAPVRLASHAEGLGAFDALMVCVKGRDTEAALAALRGIDVEAVLSLQNGVGKDDLLAEAFGADRVLGAIAVISGELRRPGLAVNTAMAGLYLGELDGSPSPRGERLAAVLQEAGIPSACVANIRRREWEKLNLYLGMGLPGAVTRLDTVTLVSDPDLSRVCTGVALDVGAVAAAEGYPLNVSEESYRQVMDAFTGPIRALGQMHYMSITQDLMAGRPTELEFTAGDVLARAARHGVAVPTLETCTNILRSVERLAEETRSAAAPA